MTDEIAAVTETPSSASTLAAKITKIRNLYGDRWDLAAPQEVVRGFEFTIGELREIRSQVFRAHEAEALLRGWIAIDAAEVEGEQVKDVAQVADRTKQFLKLVDMTEIRVPAETVLEQHAEGHVESSPPEVHEESTPPADHAPADPPQT